MPQKTIIYAKAEIIQPKSEDFRALAASIQEKYGFDIKPQVDLVYLRSCLVSAGINAGVNDNDDIFTKEEAWAARHTPVLKPFNWQHNDKDIVGVIYSVQAQDLDGNILDFNAEQAPKQDFDLWTEAVIFRLLQPKKVEAIEKAAAEGKLYVSMEAWFDDYNYGLCDLGNNKLKKIIARNEDTSILDKELRACSGTGKYCDPQTNEEMRIGRVLRSITFGGCGLVDRPANKRSKISKVGDFEQQDNLELLLQKILSCKEEEIHMNTVANVAEGNPEKKLGTKAFKHVVNSALEKRERKAEKAAKKQALKAKAGQAVELEKANQDKDAQIASLTAEVGKFNEVINNFIKAEFVEAGATNDVPPEIAAIDRAKTGADAFAAKIAWIKNSVASLKTTAARASELESQLQEAEQVVRGQEVEALLGNHVSEETLQAFVTRAQSLSDEAYESWRDEKELLCLEMSSAAKKAADGDDDDDDDDNDGKMAPPFKKGGKKGKKDSKANLFQALLTAKRGNADHWLQDQNDELDQMINHPTGPGIKSGVNPASLRTPRFKIAGTAGNDPSNALETAKPRKAVNLAGASQANDEESGSENPYKTLASFIVGEDKNESKESKPDFDPAK